MKNNKLNSIWSPNKIKFLLNIIDFINKTNNSVESIKCLEEFVTSVDKEVEIIIKTIQ